MNGASPVGTSARQLVLLHGWGLGRGVWSPIESAYRPGWRARAVDLPGYGAPAAAAAADTLASCCTALIRQLPGPAVWVGWSLGGLVALEAAVSAPESVRALVLVATTPRFVASTVWTEGIAAADLEAFRTGIEADPQGTLLRFAALAGKGQIQRLATTRFLTNTVRSAPTPSLPVLRAGLSVLANADRTEALRAVHCPAFLILGDNDPLVPVGAARAMTAINPCLRVRIIGGAGHAPFISHGEEFVAALDEFLS